MIINPQYDKNQNIVAISLINELLLFKGKPVFLCVGTDRVVCDSIGAITGELLKNKFKVNAYIYGDLDFNIDANNLDNTINHIKKMHPNSPIVLIDGILGDLDEVGMIKYYPQGAYAMGEFHKGIYVGDFSILAVVGSKGVDGLNLLKSVKLKNILKQAEFIAESVSKAYKYSQNLI